MEFDTEMSDQGNLDLSIAGANDNTHINAPDFQNTPSNVGSEPGEVVMAAQKASSEMSLNSPTTPAKPKRDNLETHFFKSINLWLFLP